MAAELYALLGRDEAPDVLPQGVLPGNRIHVCRLCGALGLEAGTEQEETAERLDRAEPVPYGVRRAQVAIVSESRPVKM